MKVRKLRIFVTTTLPINSIKAADFKAVKVKKDGKFDTYIKMYDIDKVSYQKYDGIDYNVLIFDITVKMTTPVDVFINNKTSFLSVINDIGYLYTPSAIWSDDYLVYFNAGFSKDHCPIYVCIPDNATSVIAYGCVSTELQIETMRKAMEMVNNNE